MGYMDAAKKKNHGVFASGSVTITPAFDYHVIIGTGNHQWLFENFADEKPETKISFGVSASLNVTVGANVFMAADSDVASLTGIAAGKYLAQIFSHHERVQFSASGTDPILPGQTITGPSGSGLVVAVVITSGSWAGADAAGYIDYENPVGSFAPTDNIQVSAVTKAQAVLGSSRGIDIFMSNVGVG
jgi:hypothetical protein